MLSQGQTIGLVPIKPENREGTEKIKEILHDVNDILYNARFKYIFKREADRIFNLLCDYGKKLSELEVPDKAKAKKTELIGKLRVICNSLNVYRKQSQSFEDLEAMQKAIGFFVHKFVEAKPNLTPEVALELLKESKELHDDIYPWAEDLKTANLTRANSQLVNFFMEKYQF